MDSETDYWDSPEGEEEMHRQRELYMQHQEQQEAERDMEPHKRKGWFEQQAVMADDRRKAMRETF